MRNETPNAVRGDSVLKKWLKTGLLLKSRFFSKSQLMRRARDARIEGAHDAPHGAL